LRGGGKRVAGDDEQERWPQYRPRWELLALPAAALLLVWASVSETPAAIWSGVLSALHVRDRARFTNLAVLATGLFGLLAIVKVLTDNRRSS
jgi:hypothetical protein